MDGNEENKNQSFIDKLHKEYLKRVDYFNVPEDELTRYSWVGNKKIKIYAIKVFYDEPGYDCYTLFFATKNNKNNSDEFIKFDFSKETENPEFSHKIRGGTKYKLSWLKNKGLLDEEIENDVIPGSIFSWPGENWDVDIFRERWSKDWVDYEYDITQKAEEIPTPIQPFPQTRQRFFVDRYHFNDMLEDIDDSQFTDEFNQCLFAYENEKWFLCAVGLGSCLEHLMYIILKNYDEKGYRDKQNNGIFKGFPKAPTSRDYVLAFRKNPINISMRQESFINSLFMIRNSVDHHNTGKTQKNACDLLLDGISDFYNDYYEKSVLYKPYK